jgi:sigma-B regulation protein RsbU (phosphoserine phosphatase)
MGAQAPAATLRASVGSGRVARLACLALVSGASVAFQLPESYALLLGVLAVLLATLVVAGLWIRASRAEIAREKANLRLTRSLLRSLDQGVVVANRRGEIQVVNEAARRLVGSLADTASRRGWAAAGGADIVGSPESPEAVGSLPIARAVAGEHFEDEEFFVRRSSDASGLWLLVSGAPLRSRDGELVGGVVVFRDMTAKKAQDDKVRRLTAAVDTAADMIFVTDREGRILYVNQGFEQTTGFSSAEALGETPRILGSGTHDAAHFRDMWDTILGGEVYRGTTVNRKKDGSLWHGEQTVTPMRDTQGQVTHFVSVTKDMTERRLLLEQESAMRVAGIIQQRLYPTVTPPCPGLDVAGAVFPADITCGDYFDVIPLPDGALALVIGDVSGHGIGPALIMVEARAHLRSLLGAGIPVADALERLNQILCDDIPADRFASLLVVHVEPLSRRLTHVNAGHPSGLVLGALGTVRAELDATGPALGLLPGSRYDVGATVDLDEGDVIALVTDGITELHAPHGELFEWPRVVEVVRENRASSARIILDALGKAARTFAAGRPADDDLTLLICKVVAADVRKESG